MKVGFIGSGKIAQAMCYGLIKAGVLSTDSIMSSAPNTSFDSISLKQISLFNIKTSHSNKDVLNFADVIFLAVKPDVVFPILSEMKSNSLANKLIVSLALGINLSRLESSLPEKCRVIRVMPNTPMLVQSGTCIYCVGSHANASDVHTLTNLLSPIAHCEEIKEDLMDCATSLTGSGPAYIYMIIESLADGAVKMGMPRNKAYRLASSMVEGAAKMVLNSGKHPGELKDDVCSPGGCTIEGIYSLEQSNVRSSFMSAIEKACKKCEEINLNKNNN